jgi:hypothetical protein
LIAPPPSSASYPVWLPPAISDRDVAIYAALLGLAAPQREYLKKSHEVYEMRWKEVWDRHVGEVSALAHDAAQAMDPAGDLFIHADLYGEFAAAEERARADLIQIDRSLMDELATFLADSQQQALPRVIKARQRACCALNDSMVSAARVDVGAMACEVIWQQAEPADLMQDIDGVLQDYERTATPVMLQIDAHWRDNRRERELLIAKKQAGIDADTCLEKQRAMARESARLQARLREINDQFAARFAAAMSGQAGETLAATYQLFSYPRVRGFEVDIEALLAEVIDQATNVQRREALVAARDEYFRKLEEARTRITDLSFQREMCMASMDTDGIRRFNKQWPEALLDRSRLQAKVISTFISLAPAETTTGLQESLRQVQLQIDAPGKNMIPPAHLQRP